MRYKDGQIPPEIVARMSIADKKAFGIYVPGQIPAKSGATDDERELHEAILGYCRSNSLLAFHGSMAHRTFRTPGEPDFLILCPGGKTLLVECKSKTGKLSPEQLGVAMWAEKLGHKIHVIRSFEDFMAALNA